MTTSTLTPGQQLILEELSETPRTTAQIADAAGIHRRIAYGFLMALAAKGLTKRSLNKSPTTWRRP